MRQSVESDGTGLTRRRIMALATAGVASLALPKEAKADGGGPLVSAEFLDNFVAGGHELQSPDPLVNRVFADRRSGTPIILSPRVYRALGEPTPSQAASLINQTPWSRFVAKAGEYAALVVADDSAVGFRVLPEPFGAVAFFLGPNVDSRLISTPPPLIQSFKPKWWQSADGTDTDLVLTDGLVATHRFNANSTEWEKTPENIVFGEPNARLIKSLRKLAPLSKLDDADISSYEQTNSDQGLSSFMALNNSVNEPAFFAVTAGFYGLDQQSGIPDALRQAVTRINELDPNLINILTRQYLLRAVMASPNRDWDSIPGWGGSFNTDTGLVFVNPKLLGKGPLQVVGLMINILAESRHMRNVRESVNNPDGTRRVIAADRFDENAGVDKEFFLLDLIQKHPDAFTTDEANYVRDSAEATINRYRQYPETA